MEIYMGFSCTRIELRQVGVRDETKIVGQIFPDNGYPGCPYCRTKDFVICNCGKLNCHNGNDTHFTCNWCGLSGTLGSYDGSGFGSGGDL